MQIKIGREVLLALVLVLLTRGSSWGLDVVVTTCGTTVNEGDTGHLANDLDCSAAPYRCAENPSVSCTPPFSGCTSSCIRYGVHLAPQSKLMMDGYSITGGDYGVLCRDYGCKVDGGGGTIGSMEGSAIWLFGGGKLKASNLTIHNTKSGAIVAAYFARRMELENIVSHSNTGIVTSIDINAKNVSLNGSPPGGCGFQGNLQGGKVKATNVTAGYVSATKLKATNLVVNAVCGEGIRIEGKAVLKESSITGAQDVDVATGLRPKLRNTTCGTSGQILPDGSIGPTWGVCAND